MGIVAMRSYLRLRGCKIAFNSMFVFNHQNVSAKVKQKAQAMGFKFV